MTSEDEFGRLTTEIDIEKIESDEISCKVIESSTRYEIKELLGEGGMGSVYRAKMNCEADIGKTVALKFIKKGMPRNIYDDFLKEASLTMQLEHENIISLMNVESLKESNMSDDEKLYFMVMQYVNGWNLGSLHSDHFAMKLLIPVDFSMFIISRICRALHYAHTKRDEYGEKMNIIHLDVSPDNILINSQGVSKLADFGIAKAMTRARTEKVEGVGGKPYYMSPEQLNYSFMESEGDFSAALDYRSDIYSLGIVAYYVLTGMNPIKPMKQTETMNEMIFNVVFHMGEEIYPPHKICPDIPKEVSDIVMKALSENPDDRFQSAEEMGLALEKDYLYKDRFGPTNDSLMKYLKIFVMGLDYLDSDDAKKEYSSAMPFMRQDNRVKLYRQRKYFMSVKERYEQGHHPCIVNHS